jgi:hypothetical protein
MEDAGSGKKATIDEEIDQLKAEFYSGSVKNLFFKNRQKFDCASQIMTQIPLDVLLHHTCRELPEHNVVFVDYTVMKSYANPDVFDIVTTYIINVFQKFKDERGYLGVVLNLDTFTASAAERYRSLITMFMDKCFKQQTGFSLVLKHFTVYNVPKTFDIVKPMLLPLILDEVKPKIRLFNKQESAPLIKTYGL